MAASISAGRSPGKPLLSNSAAIPDCRSARGKTSQVTRGNGLETQIRNGCRRGQLFTAYVTEQRHRIDLCGSSIVTDGLRLTHKNPSRINDMSICLFYRHSIRGHGLVDLGFPPTKL